MARFVLSLLTAVSVFAPAAFAQEPGVFVDPDSPAGKEYALPLEQARREAAGDATPPGRGVPGGRGEPLFGVGIERASGAGRGQGAGGSESAGGSASQRDRRQARERGMGGGVPGPGDIAPNARSSAAIEAAADDGSDALLTAGIAAAVLGVGLLAGFGLRRLLRDGGPS
jgi:hypothetical protein